MSDEQLPHGARVLPGGEIVLPPDDGRALVSELVEHIGIDGWQLSALLARMGWTMDTRVTSDEFEDARKLALHSRI
jgi:hypothetical protein